tara:strand:+ start:303 stop:464 length:162 start_codon:yes stop_codon:yes gene_type:complete
VIDKDFLANHIESLQSRLIPSEAFQQDNPDELIALAHDAGNKAKRLIEYEPKD